MEYYFNNLDATSFQRLINGILVARFGEDTRLTPLRGADGGRDAETAPNNPYYEYRITATKLTSGLFSPLRTGRYLFQVKHHRTVDTRITDARKAVISDFQNELKDNVLSRVGDERVNYFFLITNVPSSKDALADLDKKRAALLKGLGVHADIWWGEQVTAYLDLMPTLWKAFPQLFAGGVVPLLADIAGSSNEELPRAVRMTLDRQYLRDSSVKFKQIDLERSLAKLFVDLDVKVEHLSPEDRKCLFFNTAQRKKDTPLESFIDEEPSHTNPDYTLSKALASALQILMDESLPRTRRILLEGGPGQGKSTVTQMTAQIYRQHILGKSDMDPEGRWYPPKKIRLPLRIELKNFAEWLVEHPEDSVEEYLASTIRRYSGGRAISIESIHNIVEKNPIILIFDGLDEVGSDELRDSILEKIMECINRLENVLNCDLRVIVTTRPPALAGRRERLVDFVQFLITPMEATRVKNYVDRWLSVQLQDDDEQQQEVRGSFEKRQNEPHVKALVSNPMQLSVLLHFIRLKGPAFPDRRAELYRDYFRIVIDRDVEKSPALRKHREVIEALHQLLGYKIHALTEVNQADGTLTRVQLLAIVEEWLRTQGNLSITARELFKLGEERLGLIVSPKGEGEETRYGYEIQPIREYFAAAFINEQIVGDAHVVFEALVRRSFWREVALFLAGLRRPNEKADLLARARQLDQDTELGWRHDGRHLTLQLLQEGVFSQPQHIFSDAIEFLLDFLNPTVLKAPNDPKDILEALASLIKQGDLRRHIEHLEKLIQSNNKTEDQAVVYRIFKMASHLLDPDMIRTEIMSYQGTSPELLAQLRLLWPYKWGIDMKKTALSPSYWAGVPKSLWIKTRVEAGIKYNLATNLPVPAADHKYLVEQFAITGTSIFRNMLDERNALKSLSNLAVWQLIYSQKKLVQLGNLYSLGLLSKPVLGKTRRVRDKDISYVGLSKATQNVIAELIDITFNVMDAASADINEALDVYAQTVRRQLKRPGIISLLAYRCATNLIITGLLSREMVIGRGKPEGVTILDYLTETEDGRALILDLRQFYTKTPLKSFRKGSVHHIDFVFDPIDNGSDPLPMYMRLKSKSDFVFIVDVLADYLLKGKRLPYSWVKRMDVLPAMIPALVGRCKGNLKAMLIGLNDLNYPNTNIQITHRLGKREWLNAKLIQRILNVVNSSEDPKVLTGAQIALLNSRYITKAGTSLLLKLIRSDLGTTPFGTRLFFRYSRERHDRAYHRDVLNEAEIKVMLEVAREIVRVPDNFPITTSSSAAAFLAEHIQVSLAPIHDVETTLDIRAR